MSASQQMDSYPIVRLTSIELEHFKNVAHGKIVLSRQDPGNRITSDIVGIYGQNGSGKTSVILALKIVQNLFQGLPLPLFASECLEAGKDSFSIAVSGFVCNGRNEAHGISIKGKYLFTYRVKIGNDEEGLFIQGERLDSKSLETSNSSFRTLFDYTVEQDDPIERSDPAKKGAGKKFTVKPKTSWEGMLSSSNGIKMDFLVAQRICMKDKTSFLFSNEMMSLLSGELHDIHDGWRKGDEKLKLSKKAESAFANLYLNLCALMAGIRLFSYRDMAIVSTTRQAGSTLDILRISTHEGEYGSFADNSLSIDISEPFLASKDQLGILEATVSTISTVLSALVPGLTLGVEHLETVLDDAGEPAERIELIASRGDTTVPLRCESEGVKKLVSILVMLIDVYSKPGACVAIDELDSGVFEFLLGEILQVLQEHGRGQLIFTAHNLRPLETLDKGSLVFTTTNPSNRYTTFKGTGATNNLRSQYLRAINLGGQPETVYEPTSKFEIDSTFYDAGCTRPWDPHLALPEGS